DGGNDRVGIGIATPASGLHVEGTVQVGVNDAGHDVKFFGASALAFMEWDESADELEIRGPVATPGKLLLSTAETTVVDGNKLGQIDFQAPLDSAGTDAILVGASIYAEADATFSSSVNATELVFATGASETAAEKMRIDSIGNVGIGVLPEAWHSSYTALQLGGMGSFAQETAATASSSLLIGNNFYNDGSYKRIINDETSLYRQNNGIHYFRVSAADSADSAITWTNALTIINDGKVGIGTTAPASLLDIWTGNGASTDYLVSRWGNTSTSYGYVDWQLVNPGSTASGFPRLDVQVANASIMSFVRGGNVGIGTGTPATALHINRDAASQTNQPFNQLIIDGE
ncbi:MAG: hypothetical protein QF535_08975, partial [Anaerolineales bacterium]|nr:hypothetical protein [Anaerolineales bacterium]